MKRQFNNGFFTEDDLDFILDDDHYNGSHDQCGDECDIINEDYNSYQYDIDDEDDDNNDSLFDGDYEEDDYFCDEDDGYDDD